MRKKNKAKWIGGGIFTGICLCFTQAKSMELGGFDVEVGTGEGQEYPSDWWEEAETGVEEETGSEQEYWEEMPEQEHSGDILTGEGVIEEVAPENPYSGIEENNQSVPEQENDSEREEMPEQEHSGDILTGEGVIEEVAPENPYSGIEENNQSVPEQENDSENQSHSESQSSSMEENRTDTITKGQIPVPSPLEENTVIKTQTPTTIPDVSETPMPSIALSPSLAPIQTSDFSSAFIQEDSGPFPIFQDFSVFFHHLPVPQNQRMPYVEIHPKIKECLMWKFSQRGRWGLFLYVITIRNVDGGVRETGFSGRS